MMTRQKDFSLPAAAAASAAASGRQRRLAMTDVTNVVLAGMTPPDIIRRVKATDDFAPDIIHTATTKSCSLPSTHPTTVGQESLGNRSHRRSETFFDWDDPIISTTQSYTSYDENIDNAPTPTRRFEYIHLNTFCGHRQSRSSALSYHTTLHTTDDPSSSSDVSSNKLHSSLQHYKCNQKSRGSTTTIANSSSCIPPNISELISNLNAKAKLLADEYDDEDDASSLDFEYSDSSSDDSVIEDVIYKSVGPIPLSSSKQQCHQLKQPASSKNNTNIKKDEEGSSSTMKDLICAICLDFPDDPKHIATVSGCTHRFCFDCIEKWAHKGSNECPLCKSSFHLIASGNRVRWY
jgi:hypothetical protein